jgi:hypothetical protein
MTGSTDAIPLGQANHADDRSNKALAIGQPTFLVPWTTNVLCALCQVIARSSTSTHVSERLLKVSAARGCALCRYFFEELVANTLWSTHRESELLVTRSGDVITVVDPTRRHHQFEVYSVEGQWPQPQVLTSLMNQSEFGTPESRSCQYSGIQSDPRSEPCWNLVRRWLTQCENDHTVACHQDSNVARPSRLIDVTTLQLINGSSCSASAKYATLSHCWGTRPFTKTTTSVFQSFRTGLDPHCLPQTFQDAIYVTRKLQLQYLWIDALCIIQDDFDDWNIEAANMGTYYRHAFVNLSALSSADVHVGFLHPRQQRSSMDLGEGLRLRRARPSWSEVFRDAPLSTRAWVLQERLLSTRVLHFEKDELFWECSTSSAREGHFDTHDQPWEGSGEINENLKRCLAFDSYLTTNEKHNRQLLMGQWDRIVGLYTSLNLTFAGDRFPAIAGIAQKISEATGYTYIAGLWKERIHTSLLWHADTYTTTQPAMTQAPSWSWASLDCPVKAIYPGESHIHSFKYKAELIDTSVYLSDEYGTFAHGESAEISFNAHCFNVWCRSCSPGHAPYSDPYLRMVLDIFDDNGVFVGTGYSDRLPEKNTFQCTAMVVSQMVIDTVDKKLVTYFLLVKDMGDYTARIGIGHNVDAIHGRVSTTLQLETCDKKQFLLR